MKNQDGAVFARGFFNPYSQYRVRIVSSVDLKATGDGTAIKQMFNMTLKELLTKRIAEGIVWALLLIFVCRYAYLHTYIQFIHTYINTYIMHT